MLNVLYIKDTEMFQDKKEYWWNSEFVGIRFNTFSV